MKVGFLLNFYSKDSVIKWADQLIRSGDISEEVLEISLSRTKSDQEFLKAMSDAVGQMQESEMELIKILYFAFFGKLLAEKSGGWQRISSDIIKLINVGVDFHFSEDEKLFASIT